MAQHPWHPRLVPFAVYGAFLLLVGLAREHVPMLYPVLYVMQCGTVCALLWRYRKLLPELNLKFHWLAVPVGAVVFFGWVWLGMTYNALFFDATTLGDDAVESQPGVPSMVGLLQWMLQPDKPLPSAWAGDPGKTFFETLPMQVAWVTMVLRLIGMTIVVSLFEELFIRSLILRSFLKPRPTAIGLLQVFYDLPLIGDLLERTGLGQRAHKHGPVFGPEFLRNPLGQLTVFGVMVSSLIFMLSHLPRDWAGCLFCGVMYCLLLRATRDKGLGPVVWAHAITNGLIWVYTLRTGDWQFL